MTAPLLTDAQVIAQLGSGIYWSSSQNSFIVPATITFDIPTSIPAGATGNELVGASTLNAAQVAAAILTANLWDDLIAPSLQQVASTTGQIEFANSTYLNTITAYAYTNTFYNIVGPVKTMAAADIWFNNLSSPGTTGDLTTPVVDNYAFLTFMHEFGHALGLNHMGPYNGTGNATTQASGFQDSTLYSVMSYFGPDHDSGALDPVNGYGIVAWGNWSDALGNYYSPQTPMMNDVLAIQAIYGASTTTRTGNTVYGFHSNITGNEAAIYDFSINAHPILCIWDSSGNDTLDLSGYATNSRIDLNPGTFSDANGMTNNISIARNVIIENAVGGLGNDVIVGNAAADTLNGGAGNDTITGGAGNDLLIGGSGADTLNGGAGNNTASYAGSTVSVQVDLRLATVQVSTGDASGDILSNIQNLIGSSNADTLIGDGNANILNGGVGNDTLNGGLGDDLLIGGAGADTLIGGGGSDTASYAGSVLGVTVDLKLATAQVSAGDALGDILSGISNLTGSSFNDTLTGDGNSNVLNGGGGADTLIGGGGVDTVSFAGSATAIQVNLAGYSAAHGYGYDGVSVDDLLGISNIIGSSLNDTLVGNAGDNVIDGGAGADFIIGGGGSDTVSYASSAVGVIVNLAGVSASQGYGYDFASIDGLFNMSNILGSSLGDTLVGNAGNNIIDGGAGADFIIGGGGSDTVSYASSAVGVVVNLAGVSQTQGYGYDFVSVDGLFNMSNIIGSAQNDLLLGNAGDNTIDGGLGADTIIGNGGSDTVSYASSLVGVQVNLASISQTQGYGYDGTYVDGLFNMSNIIGSDFNDTLVGNDSANTLDGGLGNDTLIGGLGADTFRFTSLAFGNDTVLDYQDGIDHLSFAPAAALNFANFTVTGNDTTAVTVHLTGGGNIQLNGTTVIHIDATDFLFA